MVNKSFDSIDKNDIDALVSNETAEDRTLEYKESLPGGTNDEKKEFLADVSAFANAAGGDIIYGVSEKRDANGKTTGQPEAANGLAGINPDETIRRLESIILDGIAPRINGIRMKPIAGFSAGPVILMRIPKSWASPHMITKGDSRFYSRSNAGKYPLDVSQIRAAFTLSESLAERIRRFRDERVARIIAGETPLTMAANVPKRILHIIPAAFSESATAFDILAASKQYPSIRPQDPRRWLQRFNLDGLLFYGTDRQSTNTDDYLQFFRSGALESVTTKVLRPHTTMKTLASNFYEEDLITDLTRFLKLAREFDIDLPLVVMIAMIGVKDCFLYPNASFSSEHEFDYYRFDRDTLLLPDVLIGSCDSKAEKVLRPIFDAVWQSAGWDSCKNYDKNGNWAANAGLKE